MSNSTELNSTQDFFQSMSFMETKQVVGHPPKNNTNTSYTTHRNTNPFLSDTEVDEIMAQQLMSAGDSASESSPVEPIINFRLQQEILKSITLNNIPAFHAKIVPLMSSDSNLQLLRTVLPSAWKRGMLHEKVKNTGTTLLGVAIGEHSKEIVKYMLDIAPGIGNAYWTKFPPLHTAILTLQPDIVKLLLAKGVSAKALDIQGRDAQKVIEDMMLPILTSGKPCPQIWEIGHLINHSLKPDQHLLAPPLEDKSHTDTMPPLEWKMTTEFGMPTTAEWEMTTEFGMHAALQLETTTYFGGDHFETEL